MEVSILTITYNQVNYISEAIDSFLRQETNFDFEIIIGDDASTDGTKEILKQYKEKYPEKINLTLREKNVGAMQNFIQTFKKCNGKYIALCEGDDYFINPNKLQIQYDILTKNPQYSICFHRAKIIYTNKENREIIDINKNTAEITSFKQLIRANYIHTATCMFKNNFNGKIPDYFLKLYFGDWALHLINATFGDIYFINRELSAYRISGNSLWSNKKKYEKARLTVKALLVMKENYPEKYQIFFNKSISSSYIYLLKKLVLNLKLFEFLKELMNLLKFKLKST